MSQRLIKLEGGWNFRDIGGYTTSNSGRTRNGLIYRSGGLNKLTDADRTILQQLGIRTVFDLRSENEHTHEGVDNAGEGVTIHHRPTSLGISAIREQIDRDPQKFRMVDFYCSSLQTRGEYHAELFRQIVDSLDNPLVIHCSAGKDRTGIMIALLLDLAGVSDADIIADYAETATHLVEYSQLQTERFRGFGMPDPVIAEMLASAAETMQTTLVYLNSTYGSAEEYLISGGVTEDEIDRFRTKFVEMD